MLDITDEQKKLFYTGGVFKDYTMSFDDIGLVITNDTLHQEAVTIKESIIEDNEFVLGGCIASSIEFEVSEIIDYNLNGLEFTVNLALSDGNVVVPMGKYRVNSAKRVDDKDYKRVIGYDALYDASIDVSSWYAGYFANGATHTVKETREALLTYLEIPFVEQNLTNDDEMLEKTIETTSMEGTDVLRALCVINGGFGHMNREGKFEVICLTGFGLFPEDRFGENENVYPSETLYPEDYFEYFGMSDNENVCPEYRSCKYEEYMTAPITCLNIQSTTDDVGVTVGDDLSNPYVITANLFLYGKSQEELAEIGQNILGRIQGVTYRPNATELDGLPYLECGDAFSLYKNNDSVESYIFSRTLSGIHALKDTYEAKGNYILSNEVSANDEIIQLKGKSMEIKKSVEGLSIEVKDFENNTASKFEQTDEYIYAEVTRATNAESSLSSRISMTADEISSKVSKGDVVSEINQSAEQIALNSNRLVVNSTNFTLDGNGNVSVSGVLNGSSGNIGGWDFGSGYMYSQGQSFISSHSNTRYLDWNGYPYKSSIYQGKIICGVQTGSLSEGVPNTDYGYCDLSVAGFYSKDIDLRSGYLFAVDVYNSSVTTNTGAFTASDRRLKTNINEIDEQYANNLIDGLKPSTYRMIDGKRTHSGFIADEVKQTAEKVLGTVDDFAAYATVQIDEDKQDYAALRYEEFIAPLTKYCQCLKRDLKQEIEKNQQLQFRFLNLQGEFMILKQQILGGN